MEALWPSRRKGLGSSLAWQKSNKINIVEDREITQTYATKSLQSSGSRFLMWLSLVKFQGLNLPHRLAKKKNKNKK